MLEHHIEEYLKKRSKALKWKIYKVKFLGITGAPDRLVVTPIGPYLVELKRPKGGRLSARQKKVHRDMAALGWPPILMSTKLEIDKWIEVICALTNTAP